MALMRTIMYAAALVLLASPVTAETWIERSGECGQWQSRWDVQQDQSGVWYGTIDHFHVGGPCDAPTGRTLRSDVRAVIAGNNFFAVRNTGNTLCNYAASRRGPNANRARGVVICEGARRVVTNIRFRAQENNRPLAELPRDDDLLREEQSGPALRFEFRGLEELFGR
jgi:hypothetical protein